MTATNLTHAQSVTKLGTGTLTMGGALPDSVAGNWFIKQGTVVMNRAPGVTSLGTGNTGTILVGDDVSGRFRQPGGHAEPAVAFPGIDRHHGPGCHERQLQPGRRDPGKHHQSYVGRRPARRIQSVTRNRRHA